MNDSVDIFDLGEPSAEGTESQIICSIDTDSEVQMKVSNDAIDLSEFLFNPEEPELFQFLCSPEVDLVIAYPYLRGIKIYYFQKVTKICLIVYLV